MKTLKSNFHAISFWRGEERFREEGETAKKDREEGERKPKNKETPGRTSIKREDGECLRP